MATTVHVSKLNIQLNTNIGKDTQLFKRGMLKLPKMDEPPIVNSEVPYFTVAAKYPISIQSKTWKERMEFLFNREIFVRTIREELDRLGNSLKTDKELEDTKGLREEIEKHNIMITLRCLFPIPEKYGLALKNTHDHLLSQISNDRITTDINLRQAVNLFGMLYKIGILSKSREEYFLTFNGNSYEVEDVAWENDIVNHPLYFRFLETRRKLSDKLKETAPGVEKKKTSYIELLDDALSKSYAVDASKNAMISAAQNGDIGAKYNGNTESHKINSDLLTASNLESLFYITTKKDGYVNLAKNVFGIAAASGKLDATQQAEYDTKLAGYLPILTVREHIYGLVYDLESRQQVPGGTADADKIREQNDARERVSKKLRILADNQTKGNDAAEILISVKNDFEDYISAKRGRMSMFLSNEYERYFETLLKYAVQVRAAFIVGEFVSRNTPMNLTDKRLSDGGEETTIVKRVNKFIRDNFPTQAKINNDQYSVVMELYEPMRKTFNTNIYDILYKIKFGASPPTKIVDLDILERIYTQYASMDEKAVPDAQLKDYLYVGVEEVKNKNKDKDEKDENAVQESRMEIYVWMNLVDAKMMETSPRALCHWYDKMLEQEYRELTDLRHRKRTLSRYRDLDFNSVVKDPVKEAVKEGIKEVVEPVPVKKGGYTRRLNHSKKTHTMKH
jgi:hypothetical protein